MKAHPIADKLPPYKPDKLKELAADIKANGQTDPIMTYEGKILDGRNRYAACKIAKVEPDYDEFKGTYNEAVLYVCSKNLVGDRGWKPGQKATLIVTLHGMMKQGERTDLSPNGERLSQAAVAKLAGVSKRSIERAVAKTKGPKEPKDPDSWTIEQLEEPKNKELLDAFKVIRDVYGPDDTKGIRTGIIGLKKKDVLYLAKLQREKMKDVHDLIMANHWTPEKAVRFLSKEPDEQTTVADLKGYCLGTKGKYYTHDFHGFWLTIKLNTAASRK